VRFSSDFFTVHDVPANMTTVPPQATVNARHHGLTTAAAGPIAPDMTDPSGRKLSESIFEFQAMMPNDGSIHYVPGQRAFVRVVIRDKESIVMQAYRRVLQMIQATQTK